MHPPDVDESKLNDNENEIVDKVTEQNISDDPKALLNRMYDVDEKSDELIDELKQKTQRTKL